MLRLVTTVCLVLSVASSAFADDESSKFDKAADRVLEAIRKDDAEALKTLAAADAPDPWTVADALLARGYGDEALRFAEAVPRKDTERLPAYVAQQIQAGDFALARDLLGRARAAWNDGGVDAVTKVLEDKPPLRDDVVSILLRWLEALMLRSLDRPGEAGEAFAEAGERAERIGWYRRAGLAFEKAGVEANAVATYDVALRWFERGRKAEEARGNRSRAAFLIGLIGAGYLPTSDYDDAKKNLDEALSIYEGLGDRGGIAWCLNNIATIHWHRGDHDDAIATYQKAFALHEAVGNEAMAADVLGNLGLVHESRGDFRAAMDVQTRALNRKQKLNDESSLATTYMNLGIVNWQLAEYDKALELYEKARAIFVRTQERAHESKALHNIALVYDKQGQIRIARDYIERAVEVDREIGDRQGLANSLIALGGVNRRLGEPERAAKIFEEALSIHEEIGAKADLPTAQSSLAVALIDLGRDDEAKPLLEASIAGHRAAKNRSGESIVLQHIGLLYRRKEDFESARTSIEAALAIMEDIGDREGVVSAQMELAPCLWELGEHRASLDLLAEALREAEAIGHRAMTVWVRVTLADQLYRVSMYKAAMEHARKALDEMTTLIEGQGDETAARARDRYAEVYRWGTLAAQAMFNMEFASYFIESGRAGALLEALGGRDALRDRMIAPELRDAEDAARRAEHAALLAYRKAKSTGRRREARQKREALDAAREALEEAIARIQREAKAAADLAYPRPDDLETIQKTLAADEMMILWTTPGRTASALCIQAHRAWMVGVMPVHVMKPTLHAALSSEAPHIDIDALAAMKAQVRRQLLIPKATRRLLISPVGQLAYLPMTVLFPEYEIVYIPSGTTYGRLRNDMDSRGEGVLALGDPDYGMHEKPAEGDVTRGGFRLIPLPGTRDEVEAIGTVTLLGADASEANLSRALSTRPRWRSIHFACHGLIDRERPSFSALALSADAGSDGFLTAGEVFGMSMPADLVVLSACETGKGRVEESEGIMGLTRAFMIAGAPRVICSLWKVDDEATRALMEHFYERWNAGDDAATALKDAQAHVRSHEKWEHPYYWAAWVLWGLP